MARKKDIQGADELAGTPAATVAEAQPDVADGTASEPAHPDTHTEVESIDDELATDIDAIQAAAAKDVADGSGTATEKAAAAVKRASGGRGRDDGKSAKAALAAAQRKRGLKALQLRTAGVASVMFQLQVNDKAMASVATRWLGAIDSFGYQSGRGFQMFLGEGPSRVIEEGFSKTLSSLEGDVAQELNGTTEVIARLSNDDLNWMTPGYSAPALDLQIQCRSPLSLRAARLLMQMDALINNAEAMMWNSHRTSDDVNDLRWRMKREFRKLYNEAIRAFMAVNRVRNKVIEKAEGKAQDQAEAAPAAA